MSFCPAKIHVVTCWWPSPYTSDPTFIKLEEQTFQIKLEDEHESQGIANRDNSWGVVKYEYVHLNKGQHVNWKPALGLHEESQMINIIIFENIRKLLRKYKWVGVSYEMIFILHSGKEWQNLRTHLISTFWLRISENTLWKEFDYR